MSSDDEAKAQAIIDSWFWQMSESHSFRWKNAVKAMTLFYESAPMSSDIAQLVIEYLRTREAVTDFLINHKKWHFDTPGWNAKEAWYQTAPGEKWNGTESTKVRVYWVLVQAGDGTADGPYVVENGCKYKVTHWYYWDVAAAPTLPQSKSGVQYSIQGFTRDRETGLYTYIIEKRETIEQDIELYETAETAFEILSEAQFLGVKQSDVASKGQAASVGDGLRVERKLTKNADCTTDIVNHVIQEKPVEGSVKVWQKTLRGVKESTTDRSQDKPLDGDGLEVGETRRSEMTPGELWNNTVEKTTSEPVGKIAEECKKTIFEHQDVELQNVAEEPESTEAPAPADGVMKQLSVRKTEENTFDVAETTTTELKVESSHTVERKTLRGTSAATTDRNLSAAEVTSKTTTPIAVGETRTVEKTPGDKRNLTVEKFEPGPTPITLAESCEKTSGVETDTTVTAVKLSEIGTVHPQTAEVNKRKLVSYRKNEDGQTADKTVTTETHETLTGGGTSAAGGTAGAQGTAAVETTTTRKQNATTEESIAAGDTGANKVVEVENTPNGMGGFNTVKRVTEYREQTGGGGTQHGPTASTAGTTENGGATVDVVRKENATTDATIAVGERAVNKVVEVENIPNGHGSKTTVKRTTTFAPLKRIETWSDAVYSYEYCSYRNQVSPIKPSSGDVQSISFHPNDHGSYDGSYTTRTPISGQGGVQTLFWEKTISDLTSDYFYFNKQGKFCKRTFTCATAYYCYGPYRTVMNRVYEDSNKPQNCAQVGWVSGHSMCGTDKAYGRRFTNITAGAEVVVDQGSGGN